MVRDRMAGGAGSTPPNHRAAILKREGTEGDINPLGSRCSQRQRVPVLYRAEVPSEGPYRLRCFGNFRTPPRLKRLSSSGTPGEDNNTDPN